MSSYIRNTRHPMTKKYEPAYWLDDYYGNHNYGVKFRDGKVFDPRDVDLPTNDKRVYASWNSFPKEGQNVKPIKPEQLNKPPKEGRSVKIEKLHTRYKLQFNQFVATFEVDHRGKVTFYEGPNSDQVKDYHFEGSSPDVMRAISIVLNEAAKVAEVD